jgi:tetratricopeptide (TPR) repeat protein
MRCRHVAALAAAWAACACSTGRVAESYPDAPVVLISIDTLRADRLGLYGYSGADTPVIDALGNEGVVFERAYSHCPLTLPSHSSLLTGLLPPRHGVRDNIGFVLSEDVATLQERLGTAGWRTGAAVSSFVLRRQTGIARGFELFDDDIEAPFGTAALASVQRDGADAVNALSGWVKGRGGEPFMAFLHLYEPHMPYTPPPPHDRHPDPYDGEVAYADALVGRFLERLRALGAYEESLIVLTADHGEGLGDHGEEEHGLFVYRESVQVPLVVRLPGGARGGTRVSDPVGLADVAPTILDLLGQAPLDADGRSLRPALDGDALPPQPVYSETLYPRYHFGWSELYSAVDARHRYVRAPRPELYDLAEDPGETENLAAGRAATLQALDAWLEPLLGGPLPSPEDVDEDVRNWLQALGYVGMAGAAVDEAGGERERADPKDKLEVYREFRRGLDLRRAGDDAEALAAFQAVVREEPEMLDAWEMIGLSLGRLGRIEESLEALTEALRLAPDRAETHLTLARTYQRLGRRGLAREHAELAARNNPGEGNALLAELSLEEDDPERAAGYARRSLAADGESMFSHFVVGVAAQRAGRCPEALASFERAAELKRLRPNAVLRDLHANTADCLARLGREKEAEREFLAEIDAIPSSPKGRVGLAVLYFSQGRDREARLVLTGLIDATPEPTAATYWTVVQTFRVLGDGAAARQWAARARERFPADARFRPPS